MAGKNTGKHGLHASRTGGILEHITLTGAQLEHLAIILGRPLTDAEIEQTEDLLSIYRGMRIDAQSSRVSSQDIKRSVAAIGSATASEAAELFSNCDDSTQAEVLTSLYAKFGMKFMGRDAGLNPPPDLIILAARDALGRLSEHGRTPGRPEYGYHRLIAKFSVNSWQRAGRLDLEVRHTPARETQRLNGSPLHKWASAMFQIVDNRSDGSQVKRLLEKELSRKD